MLLPLLLFPSSGAGDPGHGEVNRCGHSRARLDTPDVGQWLGLLVAFDALFLGLSVLLFDYAIEEE